MLETALSWPTKALTYTMGVFPPRVAVKVLSLTQFLRLGAENKCKWQKLVASDCERLRCKCLILLAVAC